MEQIIKKIPIQLFNTNSIWINLAALKKKYNQNLFQLPIIENHKKIQGHDIIQLETAMGSAVSIFEKQILLKVKRDRFMPIKNDADLNWIRSDHVIKNIKTGKITEKIPTP